MKEAQLVAGLQTLTEILEDMKALLAWQQFKRHEARQISASAIKFNDTIGIDLSNKYSSFLSVAMKIHIMLDDSNADITKNQREHISLHLQKIETQAYYLGSPIRIY